MLLLINDSRQRFDETRRSTSGGQPPSPRSVCRNLFGNPDPVQNKADLDALNERLMIEACQRWDFDFPIGKPIQGGRYEWESDERRTETIFSDGEFSNTNHSALSSSTSSSSLNESQLPNDRIQCNSPASSLSRDTGISSDTRRQNEVQYLFRPIVSCHSSPSSVQHSSPKVSRRVMGLCKRSAAIRRRHSSRIQSQSSKITSSSFITDYFQKKKFSSADYNRSSK